MYVDNKIAFERLAICNNCEKIIKPIFACKECGCMMKIKARIENSECPLKKW